MSTFRISDGVVFRELDGEAVLLNLDSGMYYGLDSVGTRIWQLVERHGAPDAVARAMAEEYEALPSAIRDDVDRLLAALVEKGLLKEIHDERAGP